MSFCNFSHECDVQVYEDHQLGLVVLVSSKAGGESAGAMYQLETFAEVKSVLDDLVKKGYQIPGSVLAEIADEARRE